MLPLVLPQIVAPHLLLCLILECISNPLVLFFGSPCSLELKPLFVLSKTLMQKFLTYICHELWNTQITFSHGIVFLAHTPNMTMNATMISLPMAKCSTHHHFSLFSTFFLPLFSTLIFPHLLFIYAHFFVFPSSSLFFAIFLLLFPHSFFCELQNFEKIHHFLQQMKTTYDGYFFLFLSFSF